MSELPGDGNTASDKKPRKPQSDSMYLIMSMADTTWRMFLPTVGLLLLGNMLDEQWHTKPWLLLTGVTLGACIAALLVKQQIAKGKSK